MQFSGLTPSMQAWLLPVAYLTLVVLMVPFFTDASTAASPVEVGQPEVPPKLVMDDPDADAALLQGKWEETVRRHRTLIEKQPGNGRAYYHLGYAYGQLGKFSEEIAAYREAIRLGVREGNLYYNLGLALATAWEDHDGAIAAFQEGLRLAPDDPELWYNLGVAYLSKRDFTRARDTFESALERNPNHLEARNNLAHALLGLGDQAGARAAWEAILRMDPGNLPARMNLRLLDQQQGHSRETNGP